MDFSTFEQPDFTHMKFLKILVLSSIAALATFWIVGLLNESVSTSTKTIVNKPVEETFAAFVDEDLMRDWLTGYVSSEPIVISPLVVGSKYKMTFIENGEEMIMTEEITGFELNKRFEFTLDSDFFKGENTVTFHSEGDKTIVKTHSISKGKNLFFKSLLPFMKSSMEERQVHDYGKLKEIIEG